MRPQIKAPSGYPGLYLTAVVLLLMATLYNAAPVAACEPPVTPWFNETVVVDNSSLPHTVKISMEPHDSLFIANSSETNLSVLEARANVFPLKFPNKFPNTIDIQRWAFEDYLFGFTDPQRWGDGRSEDAGPPASQQVELRLLYGTTKLTVPVTLSYELNPDYEPGAEGRFLAWCATADADGAVQYDAEHGATIVTSTSEVSTPETNMTTLPDTSSGKKVAGRTPFFAVGLLVIGLGVFLVAHRKRKQVDK